MSRLGKLAGRPLGDRRRAFGVSVALLVGVAALLLALPNAGPVVVPPTPGAVQPQSHVEPDVREADAARRFLSGYLPYLYGQGPATAIRGATPGLRRRLWANRPPVPPAALERSPRLIRVETHPSRSGRTTASGQIEDGSAAYSIELSLLRRGGSWFVASVGGD